MNISLIFRLDDIKEKSERQELESSFNKSMSNFSIITGKPGTAQSQEDNHALEIKQTY
jgi:hypothetical protein